MVTNWDNIDNFWEGLASFGVGAGQGALTAVNPALGAIVGGAVSNATNNIIGQTGNGFGLNDIEWKQVGGQAILGAAIGGVTYGIGSAINQTGITNKLLDATGITNSVARNLVGSTVNGTISGTTAGLVTGVTMGTLTGNWNLWEHTWKGAAFGAAGGLAYGGLTELGYQAQLKWGRSRGLSSDVTEAVANGGNETFDKLKNTETKGFTDGGEITIEYNQTTGKTTVYVTAPQNSYWQPPVSYPYNGSTISLRLRLSR